MKKKNRSSFDIDISDLKEKLADHNPNDQNKFGILSVLENVDIQCPTATNKTQATNNKSATITNKMKWCPPIFVFNVNIKALVESLRATIKDSEFKIKNINNHKSKIYFADPKVHSWMMAILRAKEIHSYSFTPREMKQVGLVLRGQFSYKDPLEIKYELYPIRLQP